MWTEVSEVAPEVGKLVLTCSVVGYQLAMYCEDDYGFFFELDGNGEVLNVDHVVVYWTDLPEGPTSPKSWYRDLS